ncbi:hypothetical protein [Dysgonomonas sp. Marseille-P4361]|uniref:hypothetical protein n=1 Tax=Dysgonomonas sp. Marseille-P4361 TaxID=2161820 RepID=UPI000D54E881|nr:hypothetical protein [Dysgonomonas sp. Marseille-P4361]
MNIQHFHQIARRETDPTIEDIFPLRELVNEYPYFQGALFAYLKALYLYDFNGFNPELSRLSITISDRKALFYYILSEEFDYFLQQTGKKEIEEDRTNILLNAFFESRDEDLGMEEDLEYSISNSSLASTDYFSYLQAEEKRDTTGHTTEEKKLKHQSIIDTFINKAESEDGIRIIPTEEASTPPSPQKSEIKDDGEELNEDIFFTETLAKIYIKQKKYEKAYKIIKHLSLNYPKKNIYFADQLIFLEKLIINTKFKDTK